MTKSPLRFGLFLIAGLGMVGAAHASSCDQPDPPGCARDSGRFDDGNDFEDCRRQMARYSARVTEHLVCIQDEYRSTALRFDLRTRR